MYNLKPCPFCGGLPAIKEFDDGSGGVFCTKCKFRPLTHATYNRLEDKQRAIDNWNRRADGWIPVTDRLPERGMTVLTYIKHNYAEDGFRAYRVYEYDGHWVGMGNLCDVTHWMPLPQPPKEVVE